VDPESHRVYATGRDTGRVYALDGATLTLLGDAPVGSLPWGVAVNPASGKLYVANFGDDTVSVLDAASLVPITTIPIASRPTFVQVNAAENKIYVVAYATNRLYVIDGATDAVELAAPTGGVSAWGMAYNPGLNRVYVGHRESPGVTTLDGNDGYRPISTQEVVPGGSSFSLGFNGATGKLYVATAPSGSVNRVTVYQAAASGLTLLAQLTTGEAGDGGGLATNAATGNVFVTNSLDDTVSVIGGGSDTVITTLAVGDDPFAIAVDPATRRVYVGNRADNTVSAFEDTFAAPQAVLMPKP
jgi:YVTN family beta-propeller protein